MFRAAPESAVSKISFFVTTLLAAIPAAFLAYLCVAAFLFHSDALSGVLMGLIGLTLLLSVVVAALPAAVLLKKGGPKSAKAAPAAKAAEAEEAEDAGWDKVEASAEEDEFADEDPFAEDDKK